MEPAADRRHADAERAGDLLIGAVGVLAEHERGALRRGKSGDGAAQGTIPIRPFHELFGTGLVRRGSVVCLIEGKHVVLLLSLLQADVADDAIHPRAEGGSALEVGQGEPGTFECLLGGVLGISHVTQCPERHAIERTVVTAGQLIERFATSLPCPCHQNGVIDAGIHWCHPLVTTSLPVEPLAEVSGARPESPYRVFARTGPAFALPRVGTNKSVVLANGKV